MGTGSDVMTSSEVPFGMWCWPGPRASAGVQEARPGETVLAVFLDPVNLVLTVPPFPDGPVVMARLCRELARSCLRMAADLDPADEMVSGPRHRAEGPGAGEW